VVVEVRRWLGRMSVMSMRERKSLRAVGGAASAVRVGQRQLAVVERGEREGRTALSTLALAASCSSCGLVVRSSRAVVVDKEAHLLAADLVPFPLDALGERGDGGHGRRRRGRDAEEEEGRVLRAR